MYRSSLNDSISSFKDRLDIIIQSHLDLATEDQSHIDTLSAVLEIEFVLLIFADRWKMDDTDKDARVVDQGNPLGTIRIKEWSISLGWKAFCFEDLRDARNNAFGWLLVDWVQGC